MDHSWGGPGFVQTQADAGRSLEGERERRLADEQVSVVVVDRACCCSSPSWPTQARPPPRSTLDLAASGNSTSLPLVLINPQLSQDYASRSLARSARPGPWSTPVWHRCVHAPRRRWCAGEFRGREGSGRSASRALDYQCIQWHNSDENIITVATFVSCCHEASCRAITVIAAGRTEELPTARSHARTNFIADLVHLVSYACDHGPSSDSHARRLHAEQGGAATARRAHRGRSRARPRHLGLHRWSEHMLNQGHELHRH